MRPEARLHLRWPPGCQHLFQSVKTGAVGEYGSLAQTFTPDFLPTLVDWVTKRAGITH
jgi:uncharacterized protein